MKIATIKFLLRDTLRQLVKYALLGLCLKVDGHAKLYRIPMVMLSYTEFMYDFIFLQKDWIALLTMTVTTMTHFIAFVRAWKRGKIS